MTLRLKISTQMDEENFDRNCGMLKIFLTNVSYATAAKPYGVSPLIATGSIKTLVRILALYCSEMKLTSPYNKQEYPHMWREVSKRGVNTWVVDYDNMLADDIRAEPKFWLLMLKHYVSWKKNPPRASVLNENSPISALDLSTKAFRNIAIVLADKVADIDRHQEPTIKDLLDRLNTNPYWTVRWRDQSGLSKKTHNEIKRELIKHGFTLKDTKPVPDMELFRRALAYIRAPSEYTRAEKVALVRLLEHRMAPPTSATHKDLMTG